MYYIDFPSGKCGIYRDLSGPKRRSRNKVSDGAEGLRNLRSAFFNSGQILPFAQFHQGVPSRIKSKFSTVEQKKEKKKKKTWICIFAKRFWTSLWCLRTLMTRFLPKFFLNIYIRNWLQHPYWAVHCQVSHQILDFGALRALHPSSYNKNERGFIFLWNMTGKISSQVNERGWTLRKIYCGHIQVHCFGA